MRKIAAMCETHYVGLIPHCTGPIATTVLVYACGTFSGPAMMEMTNNGKQTHSHLPEHYDFHDGKLWPTKSPGLGVKIDTGQLELAAEITEAKQPIPLLHRDEWFHHNLVNGPRSLKIT